MADDRRTGHKVLGSLRSADGMGVVRMEDRLDTRVADVWSALTDPGRLAGWYGEVEGDLRLGGEFHAHLPGAGNRLGRVDTCEPPRRLALTMRDPDAQPGQPEQTAIDVTVDAVGDQTNLVVEVRGMPLSLLAAYGVGVQMHVENLTDHIAGRSPDNSEARWEALLPAYRELAAGVSAE
ncbi:MAG TPA: SRPBCC domain-containing protein [Gaiellales bacterium]|jgi:uncharacterized protein YndB with AHSA1/START domain|nr:SRPBCC domain-containing protein [Gaiellales bacterium]